MVGSEVSNTVKQYLRNLEAHGLPVSFGVVFGSQVTGNTHELSDIDLIVVSPTFDLKDASTTFKAVNLLWTNRPCTMPNIEPIPCGERAWTEDDGTPIYEVARIEGEKVHIH